MTLVQVDLLADLADRFPDGVAWKNMGDGRELSLREWHARSNQLARAWSHAASETVPHLTITLGK